MPKKPKLMVPQTTNDIGDWMQKMRQSLFNAVTENDIQEIAAGLVKRAKAGDLGATKMLFTYVLGSGTINVKQAVIMPQGRHQAKPQEEPSGPYLPSPEEIKDACVEFRDRSPRSPF